ncbi:exo-beta-N-acetylmuramidase NamZ domain-containing protein [Paenibacillus allorhizosphaerae]|uniref:DUF1343 domain-containing protein n=1 Tax=Paenibacillus allorhizosphaerae TaxID=2849866 RepID=A0ABM8VI17_9BACL|nr:DUF1343 domain-containing protein [Paenibacillus allorhizosphaerae]CAG7643393.1 hypothetical protein PAECIP111802_03008 [Paenibacillus allorhizosphaerae]
MGKQVAVGADRLERLKPELQGSRVGLLTNPTGINGRFETTRARCAALPWLQLSALFACEHGIRGERQAGEQFQDETHPSLGIPVYSLYGTRKKPDAAMLGGIDAVLFDIQDTGMRFYTYLSTLVYLMEACAAGGKRLVVLDRPNPLGGFRAEGGRLEPGYESMVGAVTGIPYATGLTIGEYARFVNDSRRLGCNLTVLPMEGWNRAMEYDATGLYWLPPSPNMPSIDTVRVYAGTCLFEGTNVSEGRGTTRPFEMIGAPWIDGERLAAVFHEYGSPGVHACPVYFSPVFSKHQGTLCGGVRLFVTDAATFRAVQTGLALLESVQKLYPDTFEWLPPTRNDKPYFIDLLSGGARVRQQLGQSGGYRSLLETYGREREEWVSLTKPCLLYGNE